MRPLILPVADDQAHDPCNELRRPVGAADEYRANIEAGACAPIDRVRLSAISRGAAATPIVADGCVGRDAVESGHALEMAPRRDAEGGALVALSAGPSEASGPRSGPRRAIRRTSNSQERREIPANRYGHGWARTSDLSRVKRHRTARDSAQNPCNRPDKRRWRDSLTFCQFAFKSAGPVALATGLIISGPLTRVRCRCDGASTGRVGAR